MASKELEIETICDHLASDHGGQTGFTRARFKSKFLVQRDDKGICLSSATQGGSCSHACVEVQATASQLSESDFANISPLKPIEPVSRQVPPAQATQSSR